jgi:hypothetical protein
VRLLVERAISFVLCGTNPPDGGDDATDDILPLLSTRADVEIAVGLVRRSIQQVYVRSTSTGARRSAYAESIVDESLQIGGA